jgi:hypothetical protein
VPRDLQSERDFPSFGLPTGKLKSRLKNVLTKAGRHVIFTGINDFVDYQGSGHLILA